MEKRNKVNWGREDLQGGFLIASSGTDDSAAGLDLFVFLEEEVGDVESELNHTPMDLNKDLALPLPLPTGSCCDQAGLVVADRRRAGLPDDDERFKR